MNISNRKHLVGMVIACVGGAFILYPCHAQLTPIVNSNIEQTSNTTSTPRPTNQSKGLISLPDNFSKVRLAPGFSMEMEVFGLREWDLTLHVDSSGNIIVPLVGTIHVAGDTLREAEKKIASALKNGELVNSPDVRLSLTEVTPQGVVVRGEVQNPGEIQLLEPRPLLRTLADAGGLTTAAGSDIEIHRKNLQGTEQILNVPYVAGKTSQLADQTMVYPGDTIFVRRAGVVYVLGAVNRPGGYLMVNNGSLNLPQAIGLALGVSLVSSAKTIVVLRNNGVKTEPMRLRLDKMQKGELESFALLDGDMVYVPTSALKSALVNYSGILSAATSASIIGGIQR